MSGAQLEPNQFAASQATADSSAILGMEGGGLIGGDFGTALSRRQKRLAIEAEYKALESTPAGQDVSWQDTGSGRTGTVRAAQPYRVGSQDCRQYTHTIEINGTPREARGTACRNEDGSWMLLG
ncbi:RT0821/Lpp0805 family surface protein [Nitratireductor kimnyeongensis]|uniref:RT0821/Lpp0805 family surface protein n=1 Tax=Nitratireductor kimnyeongensis TaxID=430679 RepID=A0ABW0T4R4_9HYPH